MTTFKAACIQPCETRLFGDRKLPRTTKLCDFENHLSSLQLPSQNDSPWFPSPCHQLPKSLPQVFLCYSSNVRSNISVRTLVPSVGAAFAIQTAVAIPSILTQSERFYDLSGSLTYLSVTALSLYLPTLRARAAAHLTGSAAPAWPSLLAAFTGNGGPNGLNWRQVVLSAAVTLWATRCMCPCPYRYITC